MHFYLLAACLSSLTTAQILPVPSLVPIPSHSGCPPDGPLLPRPTNLAQSQHVQAAADYLTSALDSAVKGKIKAGWTVDNVSFSLAIVSPYGGNDSGKPIWEYHHRGRLNTQGSQQVTGDSQYLMGSVSKVFSDLVLLKSGVDLQDPITKFFPQLLSVDSLIQWKDITLEALADHLAGIPPNYVYEFYDLKPVYESLGFPRLNKSDYPSCGVVGLNTSCTKQNILDGLTSLTPVVPVNSRPVYSQLSFLLFTLALEVATGKNYSQLLDETVIQPLNLTNTGESPGNTDRAVVPPGISNWGSYYGLNAPGGGLYSTTNDLTQFLNAILNHSILPIEAEVQKWLKPTSMTSSPTTLVGKPWEILRTTNLVPAHPHTIDIYGKSGGAMGYMSQISIIDQYGVGFIVLTAGPADSMDILNQALIGTFIPAIEEETRSQSQRYTGTWSTENTASNSSPIILTIAQDNGSGLILTNLTRNESSILDAIQKIWLYQYTATGFGILNSQFRIYPTGISNPVPSNESSILLSQAGVSDTENTELVRQDWRINLDIVPIDGRAMSDLPGQGSLRVYCASWQSVDWMYYGGEALDRIVFVVEKSGRVIGVEIPGLRSGLLT
ncbi:hypothetical protein ASPWEDRAFT_25613 [Aspergillus wentii DTO 134E9]|uniref:Uncharacterized protein n=1 Tax=Aspergillus wentii DTO 134E9 TaxID=1073089 RepID=A0A1L9RYA2_ASPWE|nr:uncharacterized protein ASPWEDRAFT_25613 [Aspergillus wentii DTO 134E9]OJJ39817.1 hypothetical protein ASPWEDRAFT_25613 [Aspergillus wentii DTO 134E9]